jgi:hypothetical protein
VGHLDPAESPKPVGEATERLRVPRSTERTDLLGHRLASASDIQDPTGGEHRTRHWINREEAHEIGEVGASSCERRVEHIGHRQSRRPGVELETRLRDHAGAPARDRIALQDGDVMAAVAQMSGGGETTESGADDDDAHR